MPFHLIRILYELFSALALLSGIVPLCSALAGRLHRIALIRFLRVSLLTSVTALFLFFSQPHTEFWIAISVVYLCGVAIWSLRRSYQHPHWRPALFACISLLYVLQFGAGCLQLLRLYHPLSVG